MLHTFLGQCQHELNNNCQIFNSTFHLNTVNIFFLSFFLSFFPFLFFSFLFFPSLPFPSLQGVIVIHEVNKDGAAHRDGRLCAGDHILEVQNFSIHQ